VLAVISDGLSISQVAQKVWKTLGTRGLDGGQADLNLPSHIAAIPQ
jgi:hypothetical protein